MQVTICGLHVRYEDDVSHAGHPFAAGLTIDSITAHTTDEDFKPYFATGVPPVVYKLASLSCLSFYLDTVRARSHGVGDESREGGKEGRKGCMCQVVSNVVLSHLFSGCGDGEKHVAC